MMVNLRTVQYCRWAEPTLFVVHPYWTDADAFPWSCYADGAPRPVEDTEKCAACERWQPKQLLETSSQIEDR